MSIVSTTEQRLKIAIYYNEVIDYLEGTGLYKICSDPRDRQSPHAFNFSIECYNKFAANLLNLNWTDGFRKKSFQN